MFLIRFGSLIRARLFYTYLKNCVHSTGCPPSTPSKTDRHQFSKPDCKTAVIVGGTGAIGLATANSLLCAKAKKIAIIDTDTCKGKDAVTSLNCSFGKDKAIFVKADVTDQMNIHDALKRARGELKQVDMIINAFGVWDETKWESEISVNLVGTLNINQVAKDIVTRPGGLVINITGLHGLMPFSPSPVLSSSFHGVVGYTKSMGHEKNSSHTNVRTVALCSGITQTPFSKDLEKRVCCIQMANDLRAYVKEACWQKPDAVAKAVIELLKYAPSGTCWVVEGSRLFRLKEPDIKKFLVLENQFI